MGKGEFVLRQARWSKFTPLLATLFFVISSCAQGPSVRFVAQRDSTDFGQACLAMLGYDGYGQDFWMASPDILSRVCGVREIRPGSEKSPLDVPHMLVVGWSWTDKEHWVVAWRDSIYDPAAGVKALTAFDERAVKREFVVPFAKPGGSVPRGDSGSRLPRLSTTPCSTSYATRHMIVYIYQGAGTQRPFVVTDSVVCDWFEWTEYSSAGDMMPPGMYQFIEQYNRRIGLWPAGTIATKSVCLSILVRWFVDTSAAPLWTRGIKDAEAKSKTLHGGSIP